MRAGDRLSESVEAAAMESMMRGRGRSAENRVGSFLEPTERGIARCWALQRDVRPWSREYNGTPKTLNNAIYNVNSVAAQFQHMDMRAHDAHAPRYPRCGDPPLFRSRFCSTAHWHCRAVLLCTPDTRSHTSLYNGQTARHSRLSAKLPISAARSPHLTFSMTFSRSPHREHAART